MSFKHYKWYGFVWFCNLHFHLALSFQFSPVDTCTSIHLFQLIFSILADCITFYLASGHWWKFKMFNFSYYKEYRNISLYISLYTSSLVDFLWFCSHIPFSKLFWKYLHSPISSKCQHPVRLLFKITFTQQCIKVPTSSYPHQHWYFWL